MLSSFLKFMNRERALSFSAAICLLTVFAAVMPGVFQEDDPFENTSLWEDDSPIEPAISTDPKPELTSDLDASGPAETHFQEFEDEFVVHSTSQLENEPDYEPSPEPFVDPDEIIESLEEIDELPADFDSLAGDQEDSELMEVSIKTPSLESETTDSETSDTEIEILEEPISDSELAEVEPEIETHSDPGSLKITEEPLEAAELDSELDDSPIDAIESLETDEEAEQQFVSNDSVEDPQDAVQDLEDSGQELSLEPTPLAEAENGQEDNVYQGELWIAPPTIEQPSNTEDDAALMLSEQAGGGESNQSPEFTPLPTQPAPEYDWSQSTVLPPAGLSVLTDSQATQPNASREETWNAPLASPQVLSHGYQPFAAGNPALGGSHEFNPLLAAPQEFQTFQQDSVLAYDTPQDIIIDQVLTPDSYIEPQYVESNLPSEFQIEMNQADAYGAYEPVYAPPAHAQLANSPPEAAAVYDVSPTPLQPPRPHPKATCPLLYCVNKSFCRLKLSSFKLCPCRQTAGCGCHGGCGCQQSASAGCHCQQTTGCRCQRATQSAGCHCQQNCGQQQASCGLLKNWFNRGHNCHNSCRIKNWLLAPPKYRPVLSIARWLRQPPTYRPFRGFRNWLLSPPTYRPLESLRGRAIGSGGSVGPGGSFFNSPASPPTRGLLSRFFNVDNTLS